MLRKIGGGEVKMPKKEFKITQFSQNCRRKRLAFAVGVIGFLALSLLFGVMSYVIAKAVIAEEVESLNQEIEQSMGVITGELNKTEEYLKELGDKVSRIVSRIDDIERYTQLHNFGYQSAQEAIDIHDHVFSKIQGESKYG